MKLCKQLIPSYNMIGGDFLLLFAVFINFLVQQQST